MRHFDTEAELVLAILSCLRSSKNRQYRSELELDAGVGLADIILYRRNPNTTRELKYLAKIPPRLAFLLRPDTADGMRSRQDFADELGLLIPAADRLMRQLQSLGLFTKGTVSKLHKVSNQPFETIIAIEAKLSDWSRALTQAYRNRQFADESWVVLDHRNYRPALAQVQRFAISGVGLASIDTNGELYIHNPAEFSPAISLAKRWHAQAALARRLVNRL